jgi:hypothetical protein
MPLTTLPEQSPHVSRSRAPRAGHSLTSGGCRTAGKACDSAAAPAAPSAASAARNVASAHRALARYIDHSDCVREVLARPGHAGSVLVIDRDATTLGDRRLVAHLAADEPPQNASLVCHHYLRDSIGRRCRSVTTEDLQIAPFREGWELESPDGQRLGDPARESRAVLELLDRHGHRHRLEPLAVATSIPQLRWHRHPPLGVCGPPHPESVRDAVARIEGYEPIRTHTVSALVRHRDDAAVSVAVLRAELQRIDASRIVLNRGLRRAVLHAMRTQGLSLSEIACRCGRIKRDGKGNASGETSWLSRRIGISPESGSGEPTPWIHSEVLALIARCGLGISPREVEL